MKELFAVALFICLYIGANAQCDSKIKLGKISVLTIDEDINESSMGKIGVVGIAEEKGFPYYFEIRKGDDKGELVQSGKYLKGVKEENRKYPILQINEPGEYTIVTCNANKQSVRTVTISSNKK